MFSVFSYSRVKISKSILPLWNQFLFCIVTLTVEWPTEHYCITTYDKFWWSDQNAKNSKMHRGLLEKLRNGYGANLFTIYGEWYFSNTTMEISKQQWSAFMENYGSWLTTFHSVLPHRCKDKKKAFALPSSS